MKYLILQHFFLLSNKGGSYNSCRSAILNLVVVFCRGGGCGGDGSGTDCGGCGCGGGCGGGQEKSNIHY